MNFLWFVFLSIIQGVTEFLPISSSGHLALIQIFFRRSDVSFMSFDIILHLGSLFAIFFYFKKDLREIIFYLNKYPKLLLNILIGTLPVCITGFFFKKIVEASFKSFLLIGICYFITAFSILLTYFFKKKKKSNTIENLSSFGAFIIGIFQSLAIFPGISRSGMTISAGILVGLDYQSSFFFSFLLAIFAIMGATIFEMPNFFKESIPVGYSILGILISFVVSYLSLSLLKKFLEKDKFILFGYYCLFLGLFIFLLLIL